MGGVIDETQQNRVRSMEWCDRQNAEVRALIHVHGFAKIYRMIEMEGMTLGEIKRAVVISRKPA